jgi:hypothetical protein
VTAAGRQPLALGSTCAAHGIGRLDKSLRAARHANGSGDDDVLVTWQSVDLSRGEAAPSRSVRRQRF